MTALLLCLTLVLAPQSVKRVIDGDTFILYDLSVNGETRIRVLGVDAVELHDTLGPQAKALTIEWLSRGPWKLDACKPDDFGRLLAWVTRGTDSLNADLIAAHLGVKR